MERRGFEGGDLQIIFDALAEERADNDWRFWVPLIALYTGARLNEICQLRKDDVQSYDGAPYLRMTIFDRAGRRVADKRLKNKPSKRNVPVHPNLIEAGLLSFIDQVSGERLFPEITPGPHGNYSHEPSKWFGHFLTRVGLEDPCLVFHSFRHGFKDACDAADVPPDYRRAMGGWAAKDVSEKYGKREFVPVLHGEVSKLKYPGFKLPLVAELSAAA